MRNVTDHDNALAFVGVAKVGHDDLNVGIAYGNGVQQIRLGKVQRRFIDERGSRMQKDGQAVAGCVLPQDNYAAQS